MQPLRRVIKTLTFNFVAERSSSGSTVPFRDSFNRGHDYLRVSLTERCNLRCRYCMPEEGVKLTEASETLTISESKHLVDIFVGSCGISKIRLTGGEPTVDTKLIPMLEHLQKLKGANLKTVAMTTNGLKLKARAQLYKDLGLDVVNISLDTLKPNKFEHISRRPGLRLVLDGLERALDVGFEVVKLNCVVIRGFNDDELVEFARLALKFPIEVRFIEFMPFLGNRWDKEALVPFSAMLQTIRAEFPHLVSIKTGPNETSKIFKQANMLGSIGFISSLTDNFCSGCNRLRLLSNGNLKVCLFGKHETSLRDLLRNGATDQEIIKAIRGNIARKKKEHAGMAILQREVSRPMIKIARRQFHGSIIRRSKDESCSEHEFGGQIQSNDGHKFSHLDNSGTAQMVNVGAKEPTRRVAIARGEISIGANILEQLLAGSLGAKGDILSVAKVAGIMGAKATSQLIPLCHQIPFNHIQIDIEPLGAISGVLVVRAKVEAEHRTGVEMECLCAVSLTLLTIYDMCKSASRDMVISNVRLVHKSKQS